MKTPNEDALILAIQAPTKQRDPAGSSPDPELAPDPNDFSNYLQDVDRDDRTDEDSPQPDPNPEPEEVEVEDTEIDDSEDHQEPEEPADYMSDAGFWIFILDMSNRYLLFPWAYRNSMFTKEEWKTVQRIAKTVMKNGNTILIEELTEEEKILMERFNDYEELKELIGFTETEIEMIQEPLAEILEKYNVKSGPELKLVMALGTVMAPRMMPLLWKMT